MNANGFGGQGSGMDFFDTDGRGICTDLIHHEFHELGRINTNGGGGED